MQPRIKIIKRGEDAKTKQLAFKEIAKTDHESEREMANKVKSWVAEWEARNRALKHAAFSLVRSLEQARQSSAGLVG